MKYVLIKYKNIKLLVNDGCDAESLFCYIDDVERLAEKAAAFYKNLLNATTREIEELKSARSDLTTKIGYKIIGVPFTNHDAELYALDKKLEYTELEITADKKTQRINVDVESPLKTLAVNHINKSEHKNLAQYIEYLISKDLDL